MGSVALVVQLGQGGSSWVACAPGFGRFGSCGRQVKYRSGNSAYGIAKIAGTSAIRTRSVPGRLAFRILREPDGLVEEQPGAIGILEDSIEGLHADRFREIRVHADNSQVAIA